MDNLLSKYKQKIKCVLCLKVNSETIIKRILGRQICSKCGLTFNKYFNPSTEKNHKCNSNFLNTRTDDNEEIIKKRFQTYNKETLPIIEYYTSKNILKDIDGMQEIQQIYKKIRQIIDSLET